MQGNPIPRAKCSSVKRVNCDKTKLPTFLHHKKEQYHSSFATRTRNSSGDEIANVIFLCDDVVHALKIQRLLHKFRHRSFSATVQGRFTKFSEITQCNGHYAVQLQGHSRSPILVPIESSYTTSY